MEYQNSEMEYQNSEMEYQNSEMEYQNSEFEDIYLIGSVLGSKSTTDECYINSSLRVSGFRLRLDDDACEGPADYTSSAPPIELMDKVNGYEDVSFYGAPLPPPTYDQACHGQPPPRDCFTSGPELNENQAREAILNFVSEHCCYGKLVAETMIFQSIENSSAFHVSIHLFELFKLQGRHKLL
uniref:Uncharacterized protein n=1 Tax=Strigamia maritima TaxID=126957 RepID=T1JCR7_STRMM